MAVEQIVSAARGWRASYYRSRTGNELDLVLERGRTRVAVECKSSSAPQEIVDQLARL